MGGLPESCVMVSKNCIWDFRGTSYDLVSLGWPNSKHKPSKSAKFIDPDWSRREIRGGLGSGNLYFKGIGRGLDIPLDHPCSPRTIRKRKAHCSPFAGVIQKRWGTKLQSWDFTVFGYKLCKLKPWYLAVQNLTGLDIHSPKWFHRSCRCWPIPMSCIRFDWQESPLKLEISAIFRSTYYA